MGVNLSFLTHRPEEYPQQTDKFIPRLSIIDVIMNNRQEDVIRMLGGCDVD
jgi:hypothetical protein